MDRAINIQATFTESESVWETIFESPFASEENVTNNTRAFSKYPFLEEAYNKTKCV